MKAASILTSSPDKAESARVRAVAQSPVGTGSFRTFAATMRLVFAKFSLQLLSASPRRLPASRPNRRALPSIRHPLSHRPPPRKARNAPLPLQKLAPTLPCAARPPLLSRLLPRKGRLACLPAPSARATAWPVWFRPLRRPPPSRAPSSRPVRAMQFFKHFSTPIPIPLRRTSPAISLFRLPCILFASL